MIGALAVGMRWPTQSCVADCAGRPRRYSAVMSCKDRVCCESDTEPCGPTGVGRAGRNDIRGTYRGDLLLVMLVIAPVIWTTGVAAHAAVHRDAGAALSGFDPWSDTTH